MTQTVPSSKKKQTNEQTPQVTVETKFMQNYRVASAVNGGGEIACVCNGHRQVELFTIGTDGTVWNFYPDTSSETGYSGVSLGLQAGALAAGVDSQGRIVVFAAAALQLFYVVEVNSSTSRWSAPQPVPVPQPSSPKKIARILTQEIAGNLYVGVLTQYQSATGNLYALAYSQWQTSAPSFQKTSFSISSMNCTWLGNSAPSAAFACIDGTIVSYNIATQQVTHYAMTTTFQSIDVAASIDSAGSNQIFAILADGNAYHLIGGSNNQPYTWAQLSQGMIFRQILVETDYSGSAQVFAVSGSNVLYHWQVQDNSPTGYSLPPAPIYSNVALAGITGNDKGSIDLFAIGTDSGSLTHLFQEETSSNWATQTMEVPTSGQVEEYISYATDVTVYDALGALLVSSPVSIWASEATRVTVNGATYFVDPYRPARTSTNSSGMLSMSQETGSLAIPTLWFTLTAVMAPGESISVQQYAEVQNRLATVSGGDLMEAKDASGNYLLADQYRNTETTDSLASAFNQCMKIVDASPVQEAHPMLSRQGAKCGVKFHPTGLAADLRRNVARGKEQHWQLAFKDGRVTYRPLKREEANALLTEKRASIPAASGLLSWTETIGDFVEGVVNGFIDIVDTVVTTVTDGVNAAFTFFANGVQYLFETVITQIEQAFDIVEAFFAQVAVIFEKIFEWLGFLFNWGDILRTHEAVAYTINQFLGFLQGSAAGIQNIVDTGISNLQAQLEAWFDQVINIAGQSSIGGYEQSNEASAPQYSSALSNNIVYNEFITNVGSAKLLSGQQMLPGTDPLSQFSQQLTNYVNDIAASPAFASAVTYFKTLDSNPDAIFTQLLADFFRAVEAVTEFALTGAQAIADSLLQLMQTLIATAQSSLNEEWQIPFVTQFYSWLTGGAKLTMLDLIALLAAIPTTIVYKSMYNAAPFPSESSVTAFENSFNSQSMLQAAGFLSASKSFRSALTTGGGLLSPEAARIVGILGNTVSYVYSLLSASLDLLPTAPNALSNATFVLELAAQGCSFPWFTSSARADCSTQDGTANTAWIYTCLGVLMDAFFIGTDGKITENDGDAGVIAAFTYGLVHIPLAGSACRFQDGLGITGYILPLVPEVSKILRYSDIVTDSEGISLIVLCGIDVLFGTAGAIIGYVQLA